MAKPNGKEFIWIVPASLVAGGVCDGIFTLGFDINRESPMKSHVMIIGVIAAAVFMAILAMMAISWLLSGGKK